MKTIFFLLAITSATCFNLNESSAQGSFNPLEELDFWSEEELPLPVYFWDNGNSGLDGATGLSLDSSGALEAAINTWNQSSINSLGFSFMGATSIYQQDAVNVSFGEIDGPFSDALGITLIDYNVDFENPHLPQCMWKATGADVVINQDYSYTTQFDATAFTDLQSLFTHELGHVIGLAHNDNQPAVMNSVFGGFRDLQPLDLHLLKNESVFEDPVCPLTSAGTLEWQIIANSGSGSANIEDALVHSVLTGDIPQTIVPGLIEPEPTAGVTLEFDEDAGVDELSISLNDAFLADGSQSIEFGFSIDNLSWIDGKERVLLGVDENGQLELEVDFHRLEIEGLGGSNSVVDSETFLASVSFDGARLAVSPLSMVFDEPLFFDFSTLEANGLTAIEIRGIQFGIKSVPEPGAIVLFCFAAVLGCYSRRRS